MNTCRILVLDPSGNYNEGQGITGWSLWIVDETYPRGKPVSVGQIRAQDFTNKFEYWDSHTKLIQAMRPDYVVIEDFLLYAKKAKSQTNSRMETPKLIGILEMYLHRNKIPTFLQPANRAKGRWSDENLERKGYITSNESRTRWFCVGVGVSGHIRDSLRHGAHFIHFTLPKINGKTKRNTL